MNQTLKQMFKLAYRKEPISNFVLIVGAVDAVIGGVGNHGALLGLGLGLVSVAIALRWQSIQRRQAVIIEEPDVAPIRYLPPSPTVDLSQRQERK
jgi:hypothetical protein